jgi:hypothetical protein
MPLASYFSYQQRLKAAPHCLHLSYPENVHVAAHAAITLERSILQPVRTNLASGELYGVGELRY